MPAPSRSDGRAFSWTFPNPSTLVTRQPSTPSATIGAASSSARSSAGSTEGPIRSSGEPVREVRGGRGEHVAAVERLRHRLEEATSSTAISASAAAPPSASHAMESSPLSGPTRNAPFPARTAIDRRSEPTPGSTTAT